MSPFIDDPPIPDDTGPYHEPAPRDDRHALSEIGLNGHEIRQLLPFRASTDACGPGWKIE